jgi:ferredoxin
MSLTKELERIAQENQADYFGVADLSAPEIQAFIEKSGGQLSDSIVDLLPGAGEMVKEIYKQHCYEATLPLAVAVSGKLASYAQAKGFKSFPLPVGMAGGDPAKFTAVFSEKLAPHLAGLGWIGKSCMLITPDHGPRVVWKTFLTDAPLEPTGAAQESRCGSCKACVEICPAKAYAGRNFVETEGRELRMDPKACKAYSEAMKERGETPVCGLCLYVCPHGRRKAKPSVAAPAELSA